MISILVHTFVLSLYVAKGAEPNCSKFDFEEKVLEKMVRIEFEMEKLKQEMQKSVETVQKMNTQVETNVDVFGKKQEVINDQIEQLEGFKNKLSEEVKHELQTELDNFKGQPDQGVDGGWSAWGLWSECSASCGTGMEFRKRSCSNPNPGKGGDHCYGDSTEYRLCNKLACPDVHVGFTVYNGDSSSGTGSNPLKFQSTLYNSDASFNNSTGVFTCIHPGVYFFSATVMRTTTSSPSSYYCYFMVNNISSIQVFANDNSYSNSFPGSSASIVLRLNKNDRVNLGNCGAGTYMYSSGISFTGFRISP